MKRKNASSPGQAFLQNAEDLGHTAMELVNTELDLGFTFADGFRLHKSKGDLSKAQQNLANAQASLDGARRFLPNARLTAGQKKALKARMNELEELIYSLNQG